MTQTRYVTVCLNPVLQKTLRFSSLTPDAVNRTGIHRLDASGKGVNVSRVLKQLGKNVTHITQLGGVMRPLFLSLCAEDGLTIEWAESGSAIRFCYTLINDADASVTELVEEAAPVVPGAEDRLLEKFNALLSDGGRDAVCLIISGTKAAGFSDAAIPAMVRRAKERGCRVILDVRGEDLTRSLQYRPDVVKPNLYEFAATFAPDVADGSGLSGDEAALKKRIRGIALELCEKHGCRIILTRGAKNIWAAEAGNFFEAAVAAVNPLNTTGCGDAFTAGLAAALEDGANYAQALAAGIRCGALNAGCFRPGVIENTLTASGYPATPDSPPLLKTAGYTKVSGR